MRPIFLTHIRLEKKKDQQKKGVLLKKESLNLIGLQFCMCRASRQRGSKEPRKRDIPWQEIGFSLNKKKTWMIIFNAFIIHNTYKNLEPWNSPFVMFKNYSTAVLLVYKLFLISSMTLFALLLSLGLPSRRNELKKKGGEQLFCLQP